MRYCLYAIRKGEHMQTKVSNLRLAGEGTCDGISYA